MKKKINKEEEKIKMIKKMMNVKNKKLLKTEKNI